MATVVGTKKMPRDERETLILDAATALFAEQGYADTSLTAIATRAGITKPLIHSYFGPKDDLFLACVQRAGENISRHVRERLTGMPANLAMADAVFVAMFEALESRPHDWPLLYDTELPAGSPARSSLRQHRSEVAALAIDGVAQVAAGAGITDADDIDAATHVWMNTLSTLMRWWLVHPDNTAADMVARCRRILAGFAGGMAT